MASIEPAESEDSIAQTGEYNHVIITGAGFSRGLVNDSPLLIDDFNNDYLQATVRGLPHAYQLLDEERKQNEHGHINIERLMTRLDSLMPYDYAESSGNAVNEYGFLLSALKSAFIDRIRSARERMIDHEGLGDIARYCADKKCSCITFNYDDFLDEALAQTGGWNPYWGYGFFCRSSLDTIASFDELEPYVDFLLLKLHSSINWRPNLGYSSPVAINNITHHHNWNVTALRHPQVPGHLEPEPVMVPPVLSKSTLVEQPVLRLVWSQAFERLKTAHEVSFVGYSFPETDSMARTLFTEALGDLPRSKINVVNFASNEDEIDATRRRYRNVLGDEIHDQQFNFDGTREWIRRLST